jgi:short-subunit dehydrogenase involved in D-alanine esterification of teichoic acids
MEAIFNDHPDVDTLINCAGTVDPHGLLEIPLEE